MSAAVGPAALWLTVIAFGAYHGLNPAMGWPLAVANGLSTGRGAGVFRTLAPLAVGHFLAMALALLPFALLGELVRHRDAVQCSAGAFALLFGAYRLAWPRHPRFLSRIRPTRLAWWSFAMATAHGAGLMLAPVTMGLCTSPRDVDEGQSAREALMHSDFMTAVQVAVVHTGAMLAAAVIVAWLCYRFFGVQFIGRSWFNLDRLWGASLVFAGLATCAMALWSAS